MLLSTTLVNWKTKKGILRFLLCETSLILSEVKSEVCSIPTGHYWEGISVQELFFSLHFPVPNHPTLPVCAWRGDTCFSSFPTVIQGVDIALLGLNNQSFARLMEQRLAPLFMMSHQQGRRFRRATTVGSYTVQVLQETLCPASFPLKYVSN